MTRSNEERLGGPSMAPPPPVTKKLSSLEFVVPTEFVELPSKGEFYPAGHPLHQKNMIEIKHMTTKEEDILTSMALIEKGVVIDRLIQSVIVDHSINVEDLLIGDKNAIIVATRAHAYGAEYAATVRCVECFAEQDYTFDLEKVKSTRVTAEYVKEKNVQQTDRGTFVFPVAGTDFTVEVKLVNGYDERRLAAWKEHKTKLNLPETLTSDFLRTIIVAVNGIQDEGQVNGFINTLPSKHVRYIKSVFAGLTPNLDMKQKFICNQCSYEGLMEVPLTAGFFWFNP